MARARKRAARRRPARRAKPATRPATRPAPRHHATPPADAERRLLALAREMETLGADALPGAIRTLAAAYAPDGELPIAVHRAWLAARTDKTAALALAWAREQLRLGLQAVIEATPPSARGVLALPSDTLAWLLLAACESLAHEPPSAAADRLRTLLSVTSRAASPPEAAR
jgi:hypothetical protein